MSPWLALRWHLDRVVALLLALPATLALAALTGLVRRSDSGPALIRLPRVGRGGRQFLMWKLRTMRAGRSGSTADGPSITGGNDHRVTDVGRVLRRWRADELPQLFNVVTGDMALIGPRPEAPDYVDPVDPAWRTVLNAKPAIAGPTQVLVHRWEAKVLASEPERTYKEVVLPVKLAIDAWYVRNASPWIDVLVAASLAQQFLFGKGVTVLHARVARDLPGIAEAIDQRVPRRASAVMHPQDVPDSFTGVSRAVVGNVAPRRDVLFPP